MRALKPQSPLFYTAALLLPFFITGCFETKQEFTLNPDGSGKVVHESKFQNTNLTDDDTKPEDALKNAIAKVLENAEGVDAWRDVTYRRLDDGRFYFKGTAYFKELSKLSIPNQTMLDFGWQSNATGGRLVLRTNKSQPKEGFRMERKPLDLSKLSAEERAAKLKEERAKFQQMKPMLQGILGTMKHEATVRVPGTVSDSSNFINDPSSGLRIQFDGSKLVTALETLVQDDVWAAENFGMSDVSARPKLDDKVNAFVFGKNAPVEATVRGTKPLFDYIAETAAATAEFAKVRKELGLTPATVAPAAQGGNLKSVKIVGIRLITESDSKRGMRPFNYDAGYTLALLAELPGSVLSITDESGLDTAIADDGTDLMLKRSSRFMFPDLTTDKSAVVLNASLALPPPGVKALKELSGHIQYTVAGASKAVDLGFSELKPDAKGTELGAQIKAIKEGWKKDGGQTIELQLRIGKEALKAVHLVVGQTKTELKQRGYSGGGNLFTFTYESETPFPAGGRIVADLYDQVQKFDAQFKMENVSLLGR